MFGIVDDCQTPQKGVSIYGVKKRGRGEREKVKMKVNSLVEFFEFQGQSILYKRMR